MKSLHIPAYAKINLTLEVLRRLASGYHEIASVMQELALHDDVILEESAGKEICIVCDDPQVPTDERNLAWKAAAQLRQIYAQACGVTITIVKRIPVGGGMGGGSADAAAVLRGLNELWALRLDIQTLQMLAQDLGMDVPFCVRGGTALATGRGEIQSPLPPAPRLDVVVAHPGVGFSTAEAYRSITLRRGADRTQTDRMQVALSTGEPLLISQSLYNDFESVVAQRLPVISRIKRMMLEQGAMGALMCGSGSGVFGLVVSSAHAKRIADALRGIVPFVAVTETRQATG